MYHKLRGLIQGVLLCWWMASGSVSAATIDLDNVKLSQLARVVYGDILKLPFMLDDKIANRQVTFFFPNAQPLQIKKSVEAYLTGAGVQVLEREGVVFLTASEAKPEQQREALVSSPLPLQSSPASTLLATSEPAPRSVVVVDLPPLDGLQRAFSPLGVALEELGGGRWLLSGTQENVAQAKSVIDQLREGSRVLNVRVVVSEFSGSDDSGWGFSAAIKALGGELSIGLGSPPPSMAAVRIKTSAVDIALGAMRSVGSFRLLQDASLRVRTGRKGRLQVGDKVPTLSQSTLDSTGRPYQSVSYQDAGLIVEVLPKLEGELVTADVSVSLSQFTKNIVSGIDSPTRSERSVQTQIESGLGQLVAVGGLQSEKQTGSSSKVFGIPLSGDEGKANSTVLVLLSFSLDSSDGPTSRF
ncbi:hypothetical protein VVD49_13435 [Uliginosibacterium sp. H3]|uniref:Type II/III secretion system secretin-like domain-containing protein n=1 Tax=Uliginosibacterium silvisoli TaxID=3114758 RepID=A0ABU6K4W6_9RHOO|nr:hypothetical protein [Uliginosibacterium sp. H3]